MLQCRRSDPQARRGGAGELRVRERGICLRLPGHPRALAAPTGPAADPRPRGLGRASDSVDPRASQHRIAVTHRPMTPNTYPPAMTGMAQRDDQRLRNSSSGSPPRSGWSSRFLARCSAISRSCPAGSRHIFRPQVNHRNAPPAVKTGGTHSGVASHANNTGVTGPSCPLLLGPPAN